MRTEVYNAALHYVVAPLAAVFSHLWLKLILSAPVLYLVIGQGWGDEAREIALQLFEIRWSGHFLVTGAILCDWASRQVVALREVGETLDPRRWSKTWGKIALYNIVLFMVGAVANYGANFSIIRESTLAVLVFVVLAMTYQELWSAIVNVLGSSKRTKEFFSNMALMRDAFTGAGEFEDLADGPAGTRDESTEETP